MCVCCRHTDDYAYETSFSLTNLGTNEVIFSSDDYSTLLDYNTYSYNSDSCVSGCTDASACNFDAAADIDDASCDYSCIGCQDSSAANYDPNATLPGDCVYCDAGTFILTVDMTDSFGDGWNTAEYYIFNLSSGALEDSGSIQTAFTGDGLSVGTDYVLGTRLLQLRGDFRQFLLTGGGCRLDRPIWNFLRFFGRRCSVPARLYVDRTMWLRRLHRPSRIEFRSFSERGRRHLPDSTC